MRTSFLSVTGLSAVSLNAAKRARLGRNSPTSSFDMSKLLDDEDEEDDDEEDEEDDDDELLEPPPYRSCCLSCRFFSSSSSATSLASRFWRSGSLSAWFGA